MIEKDINALAEHVAKFATTSGEGAPPFQEKIDALKTLTALYAIQSKYRKTDPDEDENTFADFAKQMKDDDDEASIRSRKRPS